MYNQTTNFFGRDPIQWWIGQVTDPDKGEWGDAYERVRAINGEQVYGFRCRVRIVGYHGNDRSNDPSGRYLIGELRHLIGGGKSETQLKLIRDVFSAS